MNINQNWKEPWIDQMGLIVALSGEERFIMLARFKYRMAMELSTFDQAELRVAIRQRFTPSNGEDGCQSAMSAVKEIAP